MYSVLIVDDEPWVANGLKVLIDWEKLGLHRYWRSLTTELRLWKRFEEKNPDVVISDIRMPGFKRNRAA